MEYIASRIRVWLGWLAKRNHVAINDEKSVVERNNVLVLMINSWVSSYIEDIPMFAYPHSVDGGW